MHWILQRRSTRGAPPRAMPLQTFHSARGHAVPPGGHLVELPSEKVTNISNASLNVSGNVLLHLHGEMRTIAVELLAHCLAQGPIANISGARPSGRRQRVRSVAEQIESHNCIRHGLLCSCQQQSLHSVGGHYNIRLFKLSCLKRRRNFTIFPLFFHF